ncbi:MAG: hydrogenase formation protein HypD [Campylobacter sp.]|nr:hydrogenase formation protein HypD [Campylobacter sp.]
MKLIDDFRDPKILLSLSKLVRRESANFSKEFNIMEVCGGHTHSIMKFGLNKLVGDKINFIHGPGCPVCVMPRRRIDEAIKLSGMSEVILCTLADMMRVPGSDSSLQIERAKGADIRALYSPLDALDIAKENPDKKVIFFAIGFETTTPMSAILVDKAINLGVKNLYFHINHVTVPAPVSLLLSDPKNKIDALLGPSHVSVIIGTKAYTEISQKYKKPIAISGFEPVDIMDSVLNLVRQHKDKSFKIYNQYSRVVKECGNQKALNLIAKYFTPCSFEWRGLGKIEQSGYELKSEFSHIDARKVFDCSVQSKPENRVCICGDILKGHKKPKDCKVFAKVCTPLNPLGSCMVSSEGACAAYYKYAKGEL